jgi:hypothetical protein
LNVVTERELWHLFAMLPCVCYFTSSEIRFSPTWEHTPFEWKPHILLRTNFLKCYMCSQRKAICNCLPFWMLTVLTLLTYGKTFVVLSH